MGIVKVMTLMLILMLRNDYANIPVPILSSREKTVVTLEELQSFHRAWCRQDLLRRKRRYTPAHNCHVITYKFYGDFLHWYTLKHGEKPTVGVVRIDLPGPGDDHQALIYFDGSSYGFFDPQDGLKHDYTPMGLEAL